MLNTKVIKVSFILIIILIIASASATFIENTISVEEAWNYIYSTLLFEVLAFLIIFTLIINIFIFKMYRIKKLPSFIFHLAFILIFAASIVSKHYAYKGYLHLSTEESSSTMLSNFNYLSISAKKDNIVEKIEVKGMSSFNKNINLFEKDLLLKDKYIINNAKKEIRISPKNGDPIISFEILSSKKREKYTFLKNDSLKLEDINIYFNEEIKDFKNPYFQIIVKVGVVTYFTSNIDILSNYEEIFTKNKKHDFFAGVIYKIGKNQILASAVIIEGKMQFLPTKDLNNKSIMFLDLTYNNKTKEINLIEKIKHVSGFNNKFNIDDILFNIHWGQKNIELPFEIKLNKFKIVNYPGSKDVLSYESDINIKTLNKKEEIQAHIKINEPFIYKNFTIFQSKYNRHGSTIFNINYNPAKWIFYFSYILLALGLLLNLLNPNSRFRTLIKEL